MLKVQNLPSTLADELKKKKCTLPELLQNIDQLECEKGETTGSLGQSEQLKNLFPKTFGQPKIAFKKGGRKADQPALKVGVVLSGGQAAGGHNVIAGLFDGLKKLNLESLLLGFLNGPGGIVNQRYQLLTQDLIDQYRNMGGFDLIGSGRTKIETDEQLGSSLQTVKALDLDGLVIIGGDDSNTNAAVLAEYFLKNNSKTQVIGVPKTIDGDLKNQEIELSFGFDTATKTYSEMIGNIQRDTLSAKKYTHFIKLMGRSASHITLECALKTHPNMAIIGEEVNSKKSTLNELVAQITDLIVRRSEQGKDYGVILLPEGLIEFIPEIKTLIDELNSLLSDHEPNHNHGKNLDHLTTIKEKRDYILKHLSKASQKAFEALPENLQKQLLLDRDPHGNVQVSHIETEALFIELVDYELKKRKKEGKFKGKFSPISHFFGYEGRSAFPSNFDANYCYSLGLAASLLISQKFTGYMSCIQHLTCPIDQWTPAGIPLTMMMNFEKRKGRDKPVIQKALVDLKGKPFNTFATLREGWALNDEYQFPGPIQFFGPSEISDSLPLSLIIESN